MTGEEWTMQEIVKATGTTSRTLRHYDRIGLLAPSRTGQGGHRFYDRAGLLRLQRILVLRELGLGLAGIGRFLDDHQDPADALREHLDQLARERDRLSRVMESVQSTIRIIDEGGGLVAEQIFDGFDHTKYRDEVQQRWGHKAYADADTWWNSLTDNDKLAHQQEFEDIRGEFARAAAQGLDVGSDETHAIAGRLYDWVSSGWGGNRPGAEAFTGLGEMYVADVRFGETCSAGGRSFAEYVRDAMAVYAETELS